jgi:hypothetical protein
VEHFQATLIRDGKLLLDGLSGNFTGPGHAAGFFAAPPGTSLIAGPNYQLVLASKETVAIAIEKVTLNGHRPAFVQFRKV